MLTGNKNLDTIILNKLGDEDLVRVCQVNKQANTLCNDQVFWMNRVFDRFGYVNGDVLREYKGDRTWSDYYIYDLRKIQFDPDTYLQNRFHYERLDHIIIALKNGADIHTEDDHALLWASMKGHLDVVKYLVKYLVEHGGDMDISRINEALIEASSKGRLDVVKYLVKNGADVDQPLIEASVEGYLDVVRYLVKHGADIHAKGDRALSFASKNGYLKIVKYLVEHGGDIHAKNDLALRYAHTFNQLNVVKYLESL